MRVKPALAESPSVSVTNNVMVATPLWLAAGVTVTVRFEPLPPKTIPPCGTRFVFDEVAVTVRFDAGVSKSPMVKVSGGADTLGKVVLSVTSEIVGRALVIVNDPSLPNAEPAKPESIACTLQ